MPSTSHDTNVVERRKETLITCSLAPPSSTGDILSRPRLLRLMDRALRGPVTVVTGEPASGKTTLAIDWLRSDGAAGRSVAWLTLPHRLDDELLFWQYFLAALDPIDIFTGDLENRMADGEAPDERWVNVLANRFADAPADTVVVIDDLHELDNAEAVGALRALLERIPADLHFLLLSRSNPPWPLAEWQMSGRVEEIRSPDMRFTLDELLDLVAATHEVDLSVAGAALLLEHTEGWLGGIKLAMLSMRHADDPDSFVERFAADDELVSSYLFRGVLERQEPEVRDFLLDVSVLQFINAEICDAVRARADSGALLERCRRENLFLVDLPGPDRNYRMHGLFEQLLRATLETRDPDRAELLNRRASEVFEQRGDIRATVAHAVAAGDHPRTGAMIARYAGAHASRGEWDEISSWTSLLRAGPGFDGPESTMARALTLGLTGGTDEALQLLDGLAVGDAPDRVKYAAEQIRVLVLLPSAELDRLESSVEILRQPVPDGDLVLPFDEVRLVSYLAGLDAFLRGDLAEAREACEQATRRRERPGLFYVESPGWLARVAYEEGRLSESTRVAEESLGRHAEFGSGETAVTVPAHLALADVAWERDDLDECEHRLVLAGRTVRPLFWQRVLIEVSASRLRASRGDLAGAISAVEEVGKRYLTGSSAPQLRAIGSRCSLDLALRAGNVTEAMKWADLFESCDQGPLPPALRLRLAVASGAPDLESRVVEALETREHVPSRISTLLLVADVALSAGDADGADRLVSQATALAEPEGVVRRFLDAPPQVRGLVRGLLDGSPAEPGRDRASPFFLGVLASAFSSNSARPVASSRGHDGLVDPLTDRELDVLGLLVEGRSYTDIGVELYVSRNTIKSHVRHVYTKLGVASRSEAAGEAERLGLV